MTQSKDSTPTLLDAEAQLSGQSLLVIGCTGFLGKVWLSLLLDRYPNVGTLYVMVREKKTMDAETRFWTEIAPSPVFDPIRATQPGKKFDDFIRTKIIPIGGDVSRPNLGISDELFARMKKDKPAIVNVAGVVDFNPPLDEALGVNAFGAQYLVEAARALGDVPILHTSTCFVVGRRDGLILERNPLDFPFPRADELDVSHWNAENEMAECLDVVEHTRRRVEDAPRQSHLLDEAKRNLKEKREPLSGPSLDDELDKVKNRFVRQRLVEAGRERAEFWGWPNIYTYTKSIGEQVLLSSGLPVAIVRPSIVESSVSYPCEGWCEGIQTSTPIMYLAMQGLQHIPVEEHCHYDLIPVDLCASGMIAALAALLKREHEPVYQLCSADKNPLKVRRAGELIALSKRIRFRGKSDGNAALNLLKAHTEPAIVSLDHYERFSAPAWRKGTKLASSLLKRAKGTPLATITEPIRKQTEAMHKTSSVVEEIIGAFIPFITRYEYRFSAANTRALHARLTPKDQARLPWNPHDIQWRDYWLNIHTRGFDTWAEPLLIEKLEKTKKPLRRHATLVSMIADMTERHEHSLAFQRLEGEQLTRVTYFDVDRRSACVASKLAELGVAPADRVILCAKNHPDWPIAYFGTLRSGATSVPVDSDIDTAALSNIIRASGAKVILDDGSLELPSGVDITRINLHEIAADEPGRQAPDVEITDDMIASLIYTSGTTGDPKGVMLSHENFTALIAALAPVFPLKQSDRLLSVLPLHHTFEFTCGLLLPYSRGARVVYLDEVAGDRVVKGLELGKVTSMVGVPAVWQLLERRILGQIKDKGSTVDLVFNWLMNVNIATSRSLGLDVGKLLFGPVHRGLGGHLRTLISGGSALPKDVHTTFASLGLHIAEGYGLTEAAPVLAVASAGPKNRAGTVGKAIPGVKLRIESPDNDGVGEVWAKGPNVMIGYADDEAATAEVMEDGWLKTGDLGKLDKKGHLQIVGRRKDVVVTTSGENVYPDDVENALGVIKFIDEFSVVGVPDGQGNEHVACFGVNESRDGDTMAARDERKKAARANLLEAINRLPRQMRPTIVHVSDVKLPRTATRKVKRNDVRRFLERLERAEKAIRKSKGSPSEVVRNAIAAVSKRAASEIKLEHHLGNDLGLDSLTLTELAAALDAHAPNASAEEISNATTVADLEQLVARAAPKHASKTAKVDDEDADIIIPAPVRDLILPVLTTAQRSFYGKVLDVKIRGKGNIPHNRPTIVVANHSSHLDMGLVKYALGSYGDELVALAAEDYFFKDKWRRAWFENFTYMAPLDRRSGLRKALRQAGDQLERGRTVLIFPEGTRSDDGIMREFLPLIGTLVMTHKIDVLPMWLGGVHKVLPKGASVPRGRKVETRIGVPLQFARLEERVEGMKRTDAYRTIAKITQQSVEVLRDGSLLDLEAPEPSFPTKANGKSTLAVLMDDLQGQYVTGVVEKPVSFYFSISDAKDSKWNLVMEAEGCRLGPGRPESGKADCVLKTNEEIFTKIVKESYTPSVAEFMSGKVKSNDIALLQLFQKAFSL